MQVRFGETYTDEKGDKKVRIYWDLDDDDQKKLALMMKEIGTDNPDIALQWITNAIMRDEKLFREGKSNII